MNFQRRMAGANALLAVAALLAGGVIGGLSWHTALKNKTHVEASFKKIAAVDALEESVASWNAQVDAVLDMTQLIDLAPVQDGLRAAVVDKSRRLDELAELSQTPDMRAAVDSLRASIDTWSADALVLVGAQSSARIPTRERYDRHWAAVASDVERITFEAMEEARGQIEAGNALMVRTLMASGAAILLVIAVATLNAFRTSRLVARRAAEISARIANMAGLDPERRRGDVFRQIDGATHLLEMELQRFNQALKQTVAKAAAGELDRRMPEDARQADLLAIAVSLNRMLESIDSATMNTSRVMRAFAKGELGSRVEGQYAGVFAELQRDVNLTGEKLAELTDAIQDAVGQLTAEMGPMRAGALALLHETEQQADDLQVAAGQVRNMAQSVSENAAHAQTADNLAAEVRTAAQSGQKIATSAVEAIHKVSAGAQRIAEITGMVDTIAFQTNLLALNAGVEAARAGASGRGFAVVAAEVRALAQQASEMSQQIKGLVDASVVDVQVGMEKVDQTGNALSHIGELAQNTSDKVTEISSSSRLQAADVAEITGAFTRIDEQTQKTAQQARQSVTGLEHVAEVATRLSSLTAFFSQTGRGLGRREEDGPSTYRAA